MNLRQRVLWSLFFAVVVGASEVGLYCLHWWNVEKNLSQEEIGRREKGRERTKGESRKGEKRTAMRGITRDKKMQ